jgi:hypothetical protein
MLLAAVELSAILGFQPVKNFAGGFGVPCLGIARLLLPKH